MCPITNISVHRNYFDNATRFCNLKPGDLFLLDDNPCTPIRLRMKINDEFSLIIANDNSEYIGETAYTTNIKVIYIPKHTISLFPKIEYAGDSKEELPFSLVKFDMMNCGDVFTEYGRIYMKSRIENSTHDAVLIYDPYKNGDITTHFFEDNKVARFDNFKISLFY